MTLGIRQLLALGGSLVFAIPLAIYAVEQLVGGDLVLGAVAIAIATLMVALPQYLTTPEDLPETLAKGALQRVIGAPGDADSQADVPSPDSEE